MVFTILSKTVGQFTNCLVHLRLLKRECSSHSLTVSYPLLRLTQNLETLKKQDSWFEPAKIVISFSNSAASCFQSGNLQSKRLILETVGSNLVLEDRKINIDAKKPFRKWSGTASYTDLRRVQDSNL